MGNAISNDTDLCLTIDQGGHATRAAVFDDQGRLVARHTVAVTAQRPAHDRVEYPARQVLDSIREAVTAVCAATGKGRARITAAGLATQRSNIACWDRDSGQPLSPILSWQDNRASRWIGAYRDHSALIHDITGLFPSPYYGVGKLHWCLDHLPAVRNALEQGCLHGGPMASLLLHHLLRERPALSDPVNAARTLLYDIRQLQWSDTLLDLFSFPAEILPECSNNEATFGSLNIAGSPLPLTIMTGDQSAALFASGITDNSTAHVTIGTGAFIQRLTGTTRCHDPHLLTSIVHRSTDQTWYSLEGTVNGAGNAVDYFAAQWNIDEPGTRLPRWLEQIPQPPLFVNTFSGLGTPYLRAGLPWRFIPDAEPPQQMVAIIESIVFLLCLNLELLSRHPPALQRIHIGGGLSQLDGLCQRLADLSSLMVVRNDDSETTARGLAFLLLQRPQRWSTPEPGIFEPHAAPALHERYSRWKTLMEQHCHG
ncbi:MAG: hypothetical protein HY940_08125 [Gammaproteobacteria bacterium]|nr:hypothetical protein [Gammaproteobacteria bacterium]